MTEPITIQVMGGLIIAIVSGILGKSLGGYNKVSKDQCGERRQACSKLIITKLDSIERLVRDHIDHHDKVN